MDSLYVVRFEVLTTSSMKTDTGRPGFDPRQRQRIFPVASVSRPALGPTQPPIQWVSAVLSRGKARPERDGDHFPYLVPKSKMNSSYTPPPLRAYVACSGTAFCSLHQKQFQINVLGLSKTNSPVLCRASFYNLSHS